MGVCQQVFVGNGFIRSETSIIIHGSLDGNGFLPFSTFFHSTYLDKNVTEAECINAFPTNRPAKFQFIRTLRLLGKEKSPAGWRDFFICWHYLSSRQVALQVLSARMSLTSVFGMGTGGPSSQSIPTILDGFYPIIYVKTFRF